jgi:CDP-paratose synthetase
MKIIIAGATGYLGGKIAEKLFVHPHSPPPLLTHNQPGPEENELLLLARNKNSLPETLTAKNNIAIFDIYNNSLQGMIETYAPDVVYCTTCCYETDPEYLHRTIDANYVFPSQLLRMTANLNKPIRFISVGTSLPPSLNLYSLTKKQFAELGKFFHQNGKIEFVNVLLESFYGLDEPQNRFISQSILKMKRNQDLLLTEGIQKRDYILIDDVIEIMTFLSTCSLSFFTEKLDGTCDVPVGSGIAPSIREIIMFLRKEINSKSNLEFGAVEMRKNEPSTVADLSVLRGLGYSKPITHWQDGMKKVIEALN